MCDKTQGMLGMQRLGLASTRLPVVPAGFFCGTRVDLQHVGGGASIC